MFSPKEDKPLYMTEPAFDTSPLQSCPFSLQYLKPAVSALNNVPFGKCKTSSVTCCVV